MTTTQPIQCQPASFADAMLAQRMLGIFGTTRKKATVPAEQRTDRVAVNGNQRQQQSFHRLGMPALVLAKEHRFISSILNA